MNRIWRLQLVGVPRLLGTAAAGADAVPLARKDAGWLAYTALHAGSASLHVAALLWPQAGEQGALNNLRQRVHRLRKATGARLVEMGETLTLAADLLAATEPHDATDDGALLAGLQFDTEPELAAWLHATRQAWAAQRREALAQQAADAEHAGELARALQLAQRLLQHDAVSEHAHRRLMRLHYLRGDRAAALAAFDTCERVLKDELGVPPGAETLALLQTVGAAAPTVGGVVAMPMPVGLLRPPRTVGRAQPARRLADAHAAGLTPVLVGEAGLGKTRLLQDFVAVQPQALYVQARPSDAAVPYAALARLLRGVLAAVPAALDDADRSRLACIVPELVPEPAAAATPQAPAQMQATVQAVLLRAAAAGWPTLVMDDLHFADRASVEMLCSLVDAPAISGAAPLRWVFAHRPADAADADAALLRSLADAAQVAFIRLAPLGDAEIAELLDSLGLVDLQADAQPDAQPDNPSEALATALARHTGGNPLYLIETLRAMVGRGQRGGPLPRPPSIEHLLDRRIERLDKPALALARVAAIAAPDFSIALAEQALATPALALADAWQALERADLLRGEAFAHDLVRDAVLRTTPAAIAQHVHRQVAAFLAQRAAAPARVAAHWLAGGMGREAATAFLAAAAQALASGRTREQHELMEAAAAAHEQAGDADAALQVRSEAIGARLQSDGPDAALAQADRALAGPLTPAQRAHLLCSRAMALLWAGRPPEAEADARQALALAAPDDDAVLLGAARHVAQARAFQGDARGAVDELLRWQPRADAAEAATQTQFYGDLGTLLMRAERPLQAVVVVERHLALAQHSGDAGEQINSLLNLFVLRLRRGECRAALAAAQRADTLLSDPGQARTLWAWNHTHLGVALCGLGRFEAGLVALDKAHQVLTELAAHRLLALNEDRCAEVLLLLGQTARAQALLAGGPPPGGNAVLAARLALRARVAHATGQPDEALWREAAAAVQSSDQHDQVRVGLELLRFADDLLQAIAEASRMEQTAADLGYAPLVLQAALRRLALLQQQGAIDAAATLAERVEALAAALDGPALVLPQQMLDCITAYQRAGRSADAERCLQTAQHWLHQVALPAVPATCRDGFLERNAAVRQLRALLARRALAAPQRNSTITGA